MRAVARLQLFSSHQTQTQRDATPRHRTRVEPELVRDAETQCIVLDNRGSGFSDHPPGPYTIDRMARDVLVVADAAGWDTFGVCGHSMGGMIAQHVALLAPQRVAGLLLSCTRLQGGLWNTLPTWTGMYRFLRIRLASDQTEEAHHSMLFLFPSAFLDAPCAADANFAVARTRCLVCSILMWCALVNARADESRLALCGVSRSQRTENKTRLHNKKKKKNTLKLKKKNYAGTDAQLAAATSHHLNDEQIRRIKEIGAPIHVLVKRMPAHALRRLIDRTRSTRRKTL